MKTQVQAGSAAATELWERQAKALVLAEMKKRKVGYKELSRRLETVGIQETPDRINRKVNRCKFSAAFFLACMKALETEVIDLRTGSK